MTNDLVKRLRRYGEWLREDRDPSLFNLVTDEAADRIQQLEAALRRVIAVADRDTEDFRFARAALGEKKE